MSASILRNKVLDEIEQIPDSKLDQVYQFLHLLRTSIAKTEADPRSILQFAGSWSDMSEEDFEEFTRDIKARRKRAFSSRRDRETSTD